MSSRPTWTAFVRSLSSHSHCRWTSTKSYCILSFREGSATVLGWQKRCKDILNISLCRVNFHPDYWDWQLVTATLYMLMTTMKPPFQDCYGTLSDNESQGCGVPSRPHNNVAERKCQQLGNCLNKPWSDPSNVSLWKNFRSRHWLLSSRHWPTDE